jgi:hypothetical protein
MARRRYLASENALNELGETKTFSVVRSSRMARWKKAIFTILIKCTIDLLGWNQERQLNDSEKKQLYAHDRS